METEKLTSKPSETPVDIKPESRISWLAASVLMLNGGWLFDSILLFLYGEPFTNLFRTFTAMFSFVLSILFLAAYSYKTYLSNRIVPSSGTVPAQKPRYMNLLIISACPLALIYVFAVAVNSVAPLLQQAVHSSGAPEWLTIVSGIVIFLLLQSLVLSAWFGYLDAISGRSEPTAMIQVMARSMLNTYKRIGRYMRINLIILMVAAIIYVTQAAIGSILFGSLPPSFSRRLLEELMSSVVLGIVLHFSVRIRDWVYASDIPLPEGPYFKKGMRMSEISIVALCILVIIVASAIKYRQDDVISDAIATMEQKTADAGAYIGNGNDFLAARASIAEAESIYFSLRGFFASCSPPPDAYGKDTGYYFGMALKDGVKNRYHNFLEAAAMIKRGASRDTIYGRLHESKYISGQLPQLQGLVYSYEYSGMTAQFPAETLNSLIYSDSFTYTAKPLISMDLKKVRDYGDIDDFYPEIFRIKALARLSIIPLQDDIATGLNDLLAQINASSDKVREHLALDPGFCLKIATVLTDCALESNYDSLVRSYTDRYIENMKNNTAVIPGKLRDAYLTAAGLYIGCGSYDKALEQIDGFKGVDAGDDDDATLAVLMRIYNETGRYAESNALFLENGKPGTGDAYQQSYPEACFLNSIALINLYDFEGALRALQDAVDYCGSAQTADVYVYRFALLFASRVPAATTDTNPGMEYIKVAAIDGFADLTLRGTVAWKQKDYKAAIGYLEQAAVKSGYPGYIHYLLGICCHERGFLEDKDYLDKAEVHYRKAIALLPSHGYGYFSLAECLKAEGKYDEALLAFNRCMYAFKTLDHKRDPFGLAYHARHSMTETLNLNKD